MPTLRSPIKIIGGKGVLRGRILPYFPNHTTYVEPFAGGANLLFAKQPSSIEVLNDIDPRVMTLLRVIQDQQKLPLLIEQLMLTPYSRAERLHSKDQWGTAKTDVARARMFFVDCRQSLGGMIDRSSWGLVTTSSAGGMAQPIHAYINTIKMLPRISKRLEDVKLLNQDYVDVLETYDSPNTLFYVDPPYPTDTRRDGWYRFEMTNEEHTKLVQRLQKLKGRVILSGYPNDIYAAVEKKGWTRITFDRSCNAAARTKHTKLQGDGIIKVLQARTECIWCNFPVSAS